jgi:Icc protein
MSGDGKHSPDGPAARAGAGSARRNGFSIAHISDLHCGSPHFQPDLLERAIEEINELGPDVTVVSGDLTTDGFKQEYEAARDYIDRVECDNLIVVPGNHDSRNVGYVHFEELFGPRARVLHKDGVSIVAVDSSEPDLDHGQIGRNRYRYIEEGFSHPADLRIFVLHHHLLPVPGTGRERNVVYDAGDLLEVLIGSGVHLVLSGHKHVPYAWKLEDLFVVTAGTVSSLRLRGHTRPCYNVVEIGPERVAIFRKYPFDDRMPIVEFSPGSHEYEKSRVLGQRIGT